VSPAESGSSVVSVSVGCGWEGSSGMMRVVRNQGVYATAANIMTGDGDERATASIKQTGLDHNRAQDR
jgi:hypothetical protein